MVIVILLLDREEEHVHRPRVRAIPRFDLPLS
jgi:hypothetical protein